MVAPRSRRGPDRADGPARTRGVYAISVAAEMLSMQIQNLRVYERRGLVSPDRTAGGTRLYSLEDLDRLQRVKHLLAEGHNLLGIGRVLELEAELRRVRSENVRLRATGGPETGRQA